MTNKEKQILEMNVGKEKPDMLALYMLYKQHSKSGKSSIKIPDAAKLLEISSHRVRKAKKRLFEFGFASNHSERNQKTQLIDHYILVN